MAKTAKTSAPKAAARKTPATAPATPAVTDQAPAAPAQANAPATPNTPESEAQGGAVNPGGTPTGNTGPDQGASAPESGDGSAAAAPAAAAPGSDSETQTQEGNAPANEAGTAAPLSAAEIASILQTLAGTDDAGAAPLLTVTVKTKGQDSRWRIGRQFTREESEPIPVTSGELETLLADPVLVVALHPDD
jgi:hypothetical protein